MKPSIEVAYACLSAIGNSLNLDDMLAEVIETFIAQTGAAGGMFLCAPPASVPLVLLGESFPVPQNLSTDIDGFTLHGAAWGYILDVPVGIEHFLFLFSHADTAQTCGEMFVAFRTKLANAIDACRNEKRLRELSGAFEHQIHRNEANEKLMISQSRMAIMGEMIGMIAHQWRQPITIIGLVSSNSILNIQLGEMNEGQLLKDLELIDKQIQFLSQTIDDFRNFFRPNKLPQRISYGELCDEIYSILGKSFESQRIRLNFEGDRSIAFTTYKNELLQVFLNILNNARDAFVDNNVPHPEITLELRAQSQKALFLVRDNAGGIPQEILTRIFEPYFSTKDEKHGTGLGLYMSAIIVEKHLGGTIRVSSSPEGSVFALSIPENSAQEVLLVD